MQWSTLTQSMALPTYVRTPVRVHCTAIVGCSRQLHIHHHQTIIINLSPAAAIKVDQEIETIVSECYKHTLKMLHNNRDKLEQLKDLLIEEEIVDGEKVYELLGKDKCYAYNCSVSFD